MAVAIELAALTDNGNQDYPLTYKDYSAKQWLYSKAGRPSRLRISWIRVFEGISMLWLDTGHTN